LQQRPQSTSCQCRAGRKAALPSEAEAPTTQRAQGI
jgi:hypothetical protein